MEKEFKKNIFRKSWEKIISNIKPRTLLCSVLPAKVLIYIKESINIIRRIDYRKRDIFVEIGSIYELMTERYRPCKAEPDTVGWIETNLKEGDVFYDVGANIGAYSLIAAKHLNGKVQVLAFEPVFSTYAQLCKNIFINRCQQSIIPLQIPLSDKTKMDTFNYSNLTSGASLHACGESISHLGKAFIPLFVQRVISYKLDDLIAQFKLPIPNAMKIDVDGIEYEILMGAEETLRNPTLKSIIVEIERRDRENKIMDLLDAKGFICQSFEDMRNYIFVRK